ncbi:HAD family hydrolase [Thermoanaerobacterium saccharolyticum]|uniref:Haloacid dehalogenase domain-containing protein hydrolase n=2 Tax=Thermoanaerobacterium TaxID=28895 RepID=W9EDG8_9THEO|nr:MULTISPECIES: HAD family hydrolase [Thermoanaerobacterium]AFK86103.1 Haloacid dehalogenase domain protein hydrolase [Thermoanaerobacterium saccharolyticum JW/SL-YS485]ETO39035.1 haloacid dehalogenase domain-containing protein hydrolase [Thermoanaerobacterium aotearoense SCUT27]
MLSKDSANAYRVYWKKDAFYEELIEKVARYGGMKMLKAIFFDMGNTLVKYYERHEFDAILKQGIQNVKDYLYCEGFRIPSEEELWEKVKSENHESADNAVRPLEERLKKIFNLNKTYINSNIELEMCRCFMKPIFSRSSCYDDVLPVLKRLKEKELKITVVSNTAWGSPAVLWMEELKRYHINIYIDDAVFCRDVGWRKPAKQIFEYVLEKHNLNADECIFVGDDLRWDIVGSEAVDIKAILINRSGNQAANVKTMVTDLYQLMDLVN